MGNALLVKLLSASTLRARVIADNLANQNVPGQVSGIVEELYQKHVRTIEQVGGIGTGDLQVLNKALQRLERFWTDQILYRL